MKNKEEMIEWLKAEGMTFDDFGLGEEEHGWRFMWGTYEPYLENLALKGQGLVGMSIYEHEIGVD